MVRWTCGEPRPERGAEIVEINLYGPGDAASVIEKDRIAALGHSPVKVPVGESITVDFGYVRSPLGALIEWGKTYGTEFSVHLSDNGKRFREVGRITTGDGDSDSFWWRSTTSRYFRLTVHKASAPDGAIVNELKLRILNKDRMPIGQLERAALAGRGDLYPQSLLGRQIYWTVLGEFDRPEEALFDEYGNLEPQRGSGQTTPMLRLGGTLHGRPDAPRSASLWSTARCPFRASSGLCGILNSTRRPSLTAGKLLWSTASPIAARGGRLDRWCWRCARSKSIPIGSMAGTRRYNAVSVEGRQVLVNDRCYAAFSQKPDFVTTAEFDGGDVVRLIEKGPRRTVAKRRSDSALLSAAFEFAFSLAPGASVAFVMSSPMRNRIAPSADKDFGIIRETVIRNWREKIGPRKITVGDREVSDTVEAQTAFILVNATRFAFKPGPRNYDRTWIRDGSAQARLCFRPG